jgi:zinc transporter, ZIP family
LGNRRRLVACRWRSGGAVLTLLANTMMPEALHQGGKLAGFITTVGFALAFAISAIQ